MPFRDRLSGRGLVVDDDPVALGLIAEILEEKCDLNFATDAAGALDLVSTDHDFILLDYNLPDLSGVEVCRRIKADPMFSGIPIIFITGDNDPQTELNCFVAGGVDYVTKPFSVPVLMARVSTHVTIKKQADVLRHLAQTDELTGIYNRRYLFEMISRERSRAARSRKPVSIAVFDIDYFKKVNDTYGHDAGDEVLREFTYRIKSSLREHDVLGRVGGEEFIVLLPETDCDQASIVLEKLLSVVKSLPFKLPKGGTLSLTSSAGMATSADGMFEVAAIVKAADENLYEAKESGRDRFVASVIEHLVSVAEGFN